MNAADDGRGGLIETSRPVAACVVAPRPASPLAPDAHVAPAGRRGRPSFLSILSASAPYLVLIAMQICNSGWHVLGQIALRVPGIQPLVFALFREALAALAMLTLAWSVDGVVILKKGSGRTDVLWLLLLGFFAFVNIVGFLTGKWDAAAHDRALAAIECMLAPLMSPIDRSPLRAVARGGRQGRGAAADGARDRGARLRRPRPGADQRVQGAEGRWANGGTARGLFKTDQ